MVIFDGFYGYLGSKRSIFEGYTSSKTSIICQKSARNEGFQEKYAPKMMIYHHFRHISGYISQNSREFIDA